MALPTYKDWIDSTAKTFYKRSDKLRMLDNALLNYVGDTKTKGDPSLANLRKLQTALSEWKSYNVNRNWTDSIRNRNKAIENLETEVRAELGRKGMTNTLGAGPFVPQSLIAMAAAEARSRESAFDHNAQDCTVPTHQKLVYPSVGAQDFNWNAKFELVERRLSLEVIVRIKPNVLSVLTGSKYQNIWKTQIQSAWKGASLRVGDKRFTIDCKLDFVDNAYSGPSYDVNVNQPVPPTPAATWQEAETRRKQTVVGQSVGTPDMLNWGADDRAVIGHEYGHMLGLPDEYYTTMWNNTAVSGAIYNQPPFKTNSIMNNTGKEGRVLKRHFETIKERYEVWQGLAPHSAEIILIG